MTDEQVATGPGETSPAAPALDDRQGWRGWLVAGLRIGVVGGAALGLIEALAHKQVPLGPMVLWLWVQALSFSVISHVVFGLVVCTVASMGCALAAGLLKRWDALRRPGPWAFAALLVGEGLAVAWGMALVRGAQLPAGTLGMAWASLVGLVLLVPVGMLCAKLGRSLLGRGLGFLLRLAFWPGVALLLAAIAAAWFGQPGVQSASGFPPTASTSSTRGAQTGAPNIVLIVFDALRADRLGCYGYDRPTSPHIDAFAAEAALYAKAVSPGVWTVPSHASIFTGLYPSQHGARFGLKRLWLDDAFLTLAEALRERGYETMALSNNPIVSGVTNLAQGFERFAEPTTLGFSWEATHLSLFRHVLGGLPVLGPWVGRWFAHDAGGRAVAPLAARWLAGRDRTKPFFLFINYMETHDPYDPPAAYRRRFVRAEELNRSYQIDQDNTTIWQYALARKPVYSQQDVEILSDLYDAQVREVDDYFADLIRVLKADAGLDNAVVVLTSDHGENLGERGLLGHQFCIYDTLIHVPLIVRWPEAPHGRRIDPLVQTCDLFPTLLARAGCQAEQITKVMARPLALDSSATSQGTSRHAYSEYLFWSASPLEALCRLDPNFDPTPWRTAYRAVFDGRWKLILGSGNRFELYDLSVDPKETRDLAAVDRTTVVRLGQQVGRWLGSFKHFDPNQAAFPRDSRIDDEQRRRLRDLGYVQ